MAFNFAAILSSGCGGGDTPIPLFPVEIPEYQGLDSEAVIREDNAQRLIREMFGLADPLVEQTDSSLKPEPYNLLFPLALNATIEKINSDSLAEETRLVTTNFSDLVACDAGSIDYALTIDLVTGEFSGFIDYKDCLISGLTLAGTADVTGVYDRAGQRFAQIVLAFPWMTGETDDVSYLASGTIEVTFDETTLTSLTTLPDYSVIIDDREAVKFEAFSLEETGVDPNRTLTLSGRFYQPEHGFVTVSNPTPLFYTADNIWPLEGQTQMDGTGSSLRILTEDSRFFIVRMDLNGDGDYVDLVTTDEW